MIFRYDELKRYVREDFERFCKMGFSGEQILSAVLDEYRYGEQFSLTENVCIHLLAALDCGEKGMELRGTAKELRAVLKDASIREVLSALGEEGAEFLEDLELAESLMARMP